MAPPQAGGWKDAQMDAMTCVCGCVWQILPFFLSQQKRHTGLSKNMHWFAHLYLPPPPHFLICRVPTFPGGRVPIERWICKPPVIMCKVGGSTSLLRGGGSVVLILFWGVTGQEGGDQGVINKKDHLWQFMGGRLSFPVYFFCQFSKETPPKSNVGAFLMIYLFFSAYLAIFFSMGYGVVQHIRKG